MAAQGAATTDSLVSECFRAPPKFIALSFDMSAAVNVCARRFFLSHRTNSAFTLERAHLVAPFGVCSFEQKPTSKQAHKKLAKT